MEKEPVPAGAAGQQQRMSAGRIVLLVVVVAVLASALTVWLLTRYLFPTQFTPVQLSQKEERALNEKLRRIDTLTGGPVQSTGSGREPPRTAGASAEPLQPERYTEEGAKREISFTERELNALLAKNTDLAPKLAIDLSQDMASAKLLLPLDPDFPILGGKTLKVSAGLELRYANQKPVVALSGVTVWGVPIPNAWLGGLKKVDLVGEFGGERGFWNSFAAGIDHIQVTDGQLTIKLKE